MKLPIDPHGYAVNPQTGTIHTRYASHAGVARRRVRAKGDVLRALNGRDPVICTKCYPAAAQPSSVEPITASEPASDPTPATE